jgi:hypothetical protein
MVGYFTRVVAGGKHHSLGHLVHTLPLAGPRTHALVPTADAMPAATYGAGTGSAASPVATPLLQPTPSLAVSFTLRARVPRARHHTRVHAPLHWGGAPAPPPRRCRRAHTGDDLAAMATTLCLRPFEPRNPRGFLEVIPFWPVARAPWNFTAGEVIPRRRFSSGHFFKHLGSQVKHGYCFVKGGHMLAWPKPIVQDPLRLNHSRRGHTSAYTAPSHTASHRISCGSQWD